jgi:hypothetical protein
VVYAAEPIWSPLHITQGAVLRPTAVRRAHDDDTDWPSAQVDWGVGHGVPHGCDELIVAHAFCHTHLQPNVGPDPKIADAALGEPTAVSSNSGH